MEEERLYSSRLIPNNVPVLVLFSCLTTAAACVFRRVSFYSFPLTRSPYLLCYDRAQ